MLCLHSVTDKKLLTNHRLTFNLESFGFFFLLKLAFYYVVLSSCAAKVSTVHLCLSAQIEGGSPGGKTGESGLVAHTG